MAHGTKILGRIPKTPPSSCLADESKSFSFLRLPPPHSLSHGQEPASIRKNNICKKLITLNLPRPTPQCQTQISTLSISLTRGNPSFRNNSFRQIRRNGIHLPDPHEDKQISSIYNSWEILKLNDTYLKTILTTLFKSHGGILRE